MFDPNAPINNDASDADNAARYGLVCARRSPVRDLKAVAAGSERGSIRIHRKIERGGTPIWGHGDGRVLGQEPFIYAINAELG